MMRVLYVNQTAQVSGAEHSLLTLLKGLDGIAEPLVACPPGELTDLLGDLGIEPEPIVGTQASFRLHPLHTSRGLVEIGRSSLQVRRIIDRLGPDLVYANTTRASLLALLARDRSAPPVLAHIRDWAPENRLSRLVFGLIARRAAAVVATSDYIARQFDGQPLRRPVRVIHDPIDLERFDPRRADGAAIRRELGLASDDLVFAVVAQLTPWKGQDDAIRALASLVASGREAVLLLVGSAKFAAVGTQFDNAAFGRQLHRLAADLGVESRVHFLGERPDVPDILAATDVLLFPSWREAFGRIAVEAMAMGLPVAATEVGGPGEIVRPGVDGVLLPPRAPDVWGRALEPFVDDRELRERMGRNAARRAQDFGIDVHVAQMLDLYHDLSDSPSA
jgi:L-malate glycosyltransferase